MKFFRKFGGFSWVFRQNPESNEVFHEKIVKKYLKKNSLREKKQVHKCSLLYNPLFLV